MPVQEEREVAREEEEQIQCASSIEASVDAAPISMLSQHAQMHLHSNPGTSTDMFTSHAQVGTEETKTFTMDVALQSMHSLSDTTSDTTVLGESSNESGGSSLTLLCPWDCENDVAEHVALGSTKINNGHGTELEMDVSNFHFMDLSPFDASPGREVYQAGSTVKSVQLERDQLQCPLRS